jgi:hypothetical protein
MSDRDKEAYELRLASQSLDGIKLKAKSYANYYKIQNLLKGRTKAEMTAKLLSRLRLASPGRVEVALPPWSILNNIPPELPPPSPADVAFFERMGTQELIALGQRFNDYYDVGNTTTRTKAQLMEMLSSLLSKDLSNDAKPPFAYGAEGAQVPPPAPAPPPPPPPAPSPPSPPSPPPAVLPQALPLAVKAPLDFEEEVKPPPVPKKYTIKELADFDAFEYTGGFVHPLTGDITMPGEMEEFGRNIRGDVVDLDANYIGTWDAEKGKIIPAKTQVVSERRLSSGLFHRERVVVPPADWPAIVREMNGDNDYVPAVAPAPMSLPPLSSFYKGPPGGPLPPLTDRQKREAETREARKAYYEKAMEHMRKNHVPDIVTDVVRRQLGEPEKMLVGSLVKGQEEFGKLDELLERLLPYTLGDKSEGEKRRWGWAFNYWFDNWFYKEQYEKGRRSLSVLEGLKEVKDRKKFTLKDKGEALAVAPLGI